MTMQGKVALVTGASSGIGRATALRLAQAGMDVVLNYWTMDEEAEQTAQAIRDLGRRALLQKVDVSDYDAVEAMARETVSQLSRIDSFVSCAVYSDRESFLTANLEGFRRTLDVSLMGAFYCLRASCKRMVEQGDGGSVVIVSSPHAKIAFPDAMAYNIAKAGLDQMARTAAMELLEHRIRVNICYPGWTDTPGERKFFDDETIRKASASLPMGRLATSEEIAEGILFLVDDRSAYMTGEILHLDGGIFLPWWSKRDDGGF